MYLRKALWSQQINNEETYLLKYMSFGGHQSQAIERIKALCDMYNNNINNLLRKRDLKLYKKNISNFCRFLLSFFIVRIFIVIKYSTTTCQLSTEQ